MMKTLLYCIFILVIFISAKEDASYKYYGPFDWLYNDNGQLIADTNLALDNRIGCEMNFEFGLDSMYSFGNQFQILNNLSFPEISLNTGADMEFILEVKCIRDPFSQSKHKFKVDNVFVYSPYPKTYFMVEYKDRLIEDLKRVEFSVHCETDEFVVHIPIKVDLCFVNKKKSYCGLGSHQFVSPVITKRFQNGFFYISLVSSIGLQ